MVTFSYMEPRYKAWIAAAKVKPGWQGAIDRAAKTLLAGKERYKAIEALTGVPWAWIAVAHYRECNGNFKGVLHNGELIVGTGRRTSLVPAGRGPFSTWEESALDAIKIMGWGNVIWTPEMMCYRWEAFNGYGYAQMGRPSPYVWSGTNIYESGKFTSDHNYDPDVVDSQVGCWPVYQRLLELDKETVVRGESKKIDILDTVRLGAKGVIGTVLAWAATIQITDAQSLFNAGAALALVVMAGFIWWLTNKMDSMIVSDYNEGRYVPSGAVEDQPVVPATPPPKEPEMNFQLFMPMIQQLLMALLAQAQQPGQPTPVPQPVPIPVPVPVPSPTPPSGGDMNVFLKNLVTAVLLAAAQEVMKELPNLMAKTKA